MIQSFLQKLLAEFPFSARVPWNLVVVIMDGADTSTKAEIPVAEAVKFIEGRTRFEFRVHYVNTSTPHDYTGFQDQGRTKYVMLRDDIDAAFIQSLPAATSYLFLYKMNGREPLQAGSSMALVDGLMVDGKRRPYATVPVDPWWYNLDPAGGFKTWSASVVTHEIINTIQAKVEAAPYNCGQLVGEDDPVPFVYEGRRLERLTGACYAMLAKDED